MDDPDTRPTAYLPERSASPSRPHRLMVSGKVRRDEPSPTREAVPGIRSSAVCRTGTQPGCVG